MKHRKLMAVTMGILLLGAQAAIVPAHADEHGLITIVDGSDSARRVLYIDGMEYALAKSVSMSSESGGTYDPLLLRPGQPVQITWTTVKGVKTITAIRVLQSIPQ